MSKTTAKVEYRIYVPYGYIAVKYCHVNFYGEDTARLKEAWHNVRYKRYYEQKESSGVDRLEEEVRQLRAEKNTLTEENEKLEEEIRASHRWYQLWSNKTQRKMKKTIKKNTIRIIEIEKLLEKKRESISDILGELFYTESELHTKAESFLEEEGFVIIHSSTGECASHTDIWEKKND